MVFSIKIYSNNFTDSSSDSDNDMDVLDPYQIYELEEKLMSNYRLLDINKNKIKKKQKDNYLLESLSNKYNEINELMLTEKQKIAKHLQLLNKYIDKNNSSNKKINFLLKNEKKNIKDELKKINSI